ncbi:MAG: GGDEF domain-containing protein, partial [Rhizobium giardinii]
MTNVLLFLCEGLVYVAVMITLLHLRHLLGIGVFIAALGVLHFIETYLAAVFYVQLPFGVISPGSAVLFAGKLMMILLLYLKEDA